MLNQVLYKSAYGNWELQLQFGQELQSGAFSEPPRHSHPVLNVGYKIRVFRKRELPFDEWQTLRHHDVVVRKQNEIYPVVPLKEEFINSD